MSYEDQVLLDAPILRWTFEESVSPYTDSVSNVQLAGAAPVYSYAGGPTGKNYISILSSFSLTETDVLPPTSAFSFECWLRPTNDYGADGQFGLFGDFGQWILTTNANGSISAGIDGTFIRTPDNTVPVGTWKHVVYTQGSGTGKIYVDGLLIIDGPQADAVWTQIGMQGGIFLGVGSADIAEFAIYDKELSADRVLSHFTGDSVTTGGDSLPYKTVVLQANPFLYYRLEDTTAGTMRDSSGHQLNGFFHGSVSLQQTAVIADPGYSVYLPGSNASLQLNNDPDFSPFNSIGVCVEFWIVWSSSDSDDETLVRFDDGDSSSLQRCQITLRPNETVVGFPGIAGYQSLPAIEKNARTYVVFTIGPQHSVPGNNTGVFFNGVKVSSGAGSGSTSSIINALLGESFTGKIDEIALYKRYLTQDEINRHYAAGLQYHSNVNVYTRSVSEFLVFNEAVYEQKVTAGGGNIYNITVSEAISFSEGSGGPVPQQDVSERMSLTESLATEQRPFRRTVKEIIPLNDTAHGSPNRQVISESLVFTESVNPHMTQPEVREDLFFIEDVGLQANHQYLVESIEFEEDVFAHYAISNQSATETIEFYETAELHYHVANIEISETINFSESMSRVLELDVGEEIDWTESLEHVFPEDFFEQIEWTEEVEVQASKEILESITFFEVLCYQADWNRGTSENIEFREYVAVLLNNQNDPNNGGTVPGGNGITTSTTYRKVVFEQIRFVEKVVSDPEPFDPNCIVEID